MPRSASAQSALTWARVELTRNQVQLFTNGRSRRARVSDVLGLNDALSTARSARAELRFNDGSLARIGESAVFRFTPNTRNFRLSNGTVLQLLPPGQGRTTIQTPNATTGIHGSALFVRYVPETETTIIGALTNNPEGPMMAFNEDGSLQQPLYAGEMAVLRKGELEHLSFDLPYFIETSDLLADMDLDDPEAATGDAGIDAVRQEIQDALDQQQSFDNGDDFIENPDFLSAGPNTPIASAPPIQDFSRSPAADFLLQQDGIVASGTVNPLPGSVPRNPPPTAAPDQPVTEPQPPVVKPVDPQLPGPVAGPVEEQPTQPVTPPTVPEPTTPVDPIEKPPLNEPTLIEQPAPAPVEPPEVGVTPETPVTTPIEQPIIKPTELPVVPEEAAVLPPETIIPPVDTVVELETEAQVERLTDSETLLPEATTGPAEEAPLTETTPLEN